MRNLFIAIPLCAAAIPHAALACASCGCTLTADWLAQGLITQPGTTIGLRYDFIPQTDLRTERRDIDQDDIALPADREIERYTYNHTATFSLDHQGRGPWGVNLQVPIVLRPHATFAEGDTEPSRSRTDGLGDVRIVGRWQGSSRPGSITGIEFGVQLPTGRIHQRFISGPATGEYADRGIQAGFGATQIIAGAYHQGGIAPRFNYLIQLSGQLPVTTRDHFRPGRFGQVSAAIDYTGPGILTVQMQANFRITQRDHGANSDIENSGGEQLYLSPGLIGRIGARTSAFAYVQVPVYQRLTGYQLAPRITASFGLQHRF